VVHAKLGATKKESAAQRSFDARMAALSKPADIYTINPEGVLLFLDKVKPRPQFDLVVVDESTKFKNFTAGRFKALKRLLKGVPLRIALSGTPAANCLADLFAQMYIIDDGEALGKTLTYFRSMFMQKGGYMNYEWLFREDREEMIHKAIAHMVLRLDSLDHLDLPERVWNKVWMDLPDSIKPRYQQLERELFYRLDQGENVVASGGGGLYAMCRGLANGGLYEHPELSPRITHQIHEAKTEAFVDKVEELSGKPVLGAYSFYHDLDRLKKVFPDAPVINGKTSPKRSDEILDEWDKQNIHVLLVHPGSVEHGLNMQYGGCNDVVWYSLPDKPESYQQLNARLWRDGTVGQVRYHHIMARDTIDIAVWDRLQMKGKRQRALLEALKKYKHEKETGACLCV
jgi:SNF2 family DNA or RNA helicase